MMGAGVSNLLLAKSQAAGDEDTKDVSVGFGCPVAV